MIIENPTILTCLVLILTPWTAAAQCPVTRVNQFDFTCDRQGWVRKPSVLRTIKKETQEACASACLAKTQCKAFKYRAVSTLCTLYSQILLAMETEYDDNYKPGRLFERECYSTDCNVINACTATISNRCDFVSGRAFYKLQYACRYGYTASPDGHKKYVRQLNGSMSTCQAIDACIGSGRSCSRTCDIHYHKPSNQWVCTEYYDYGPDHYYYPEEYYDTPSIKAQGVYRTRYGVPNNTVGAGYGFYMEGVY